MWKWMLLAGLLCWGGIVALAYAAQRALMYFPDRTRTPPTLVGLPQAEEIVLATADGERVIIWYVSADRDKPVIVYFHGNGGALAARAHRFRALVADGTGLVALSYRGYGGSTGSPSEAGLIQDGETACQFATARYPTHRIVLWGESLGSGVAVALAAVRPVGAIVLESSFTSAADVGARQYPFLPVRLLMKDPFRSDLRAADVRAPALVLHGGRDKVVPIALGERLYARLPGPKEFIRFPQGGHNDLDRYGALDAIRAFLAATAPAEASGTLIDQNVS